MEENNNKVNLKVGVRIIDMVIGATIALASFAVFSFIENKYIMWVLIIWIIAVSSVGYILYILSNERRKIKITERGISKVVLLNEENISIKEWSLVDKVSVLIGKTTFEEVVDIDLNDSIYSPLIDNNHAVLNYAEGSWFIEDLSYDKGVAIEKAEDNEKYNIVKGSPCTVKKEILSIFLR